MARLYGSPLRRAEIQDVKIDAREAVHSQHAAEGWCPVAAKVNLQQQIRAAPIGKSWKIAAIGHA
jgi:hypothetical protein